MRLKPGADTAVMDSTGHVRDHSDEYLTRAVIFTRPQTCSGAPAPVLLLVQPGSRHWPSEGRTTQPAYSSRCRT